MQTVRYCCVLRVTGPSNGEGDRSCEISGMLGTDTERSEDGLRRGYPRRAMSEAETSAQKEMYTTVRDGASNYLPFCCSKHQQFHAQCKTLAIAGECT